jgi:DNA ligase-1
MKMEEIILGHKIKSFSPLYTYDSKGRVRVWNIWVERMTTGNYNIVTHHGLVDGKRQIERVIIKEGKNLGRANETTPQEQAISEAESKWNGMQDKGYATNVDKIVRNLPMLAKSFDKYKHKVNYPCFVQPKLNGVRCLAKRVGDSIEFTSRKGKYYHTLKHLEKELLQVMEETEILDGEIYIHGEVFQDIISAVKNVKNKERAQLDCNKLEFWVYDYADSNLDYRDRLHILKDKLINTDVKLKFVKFVITNKAENKQQVLDAHKLFVSYGYEGVIIRNREGGYEFNCRSNNLQKYKEFLDEEFEIIGVKSGVGRYEKCGTFIVKTKDGKEFDVNPKGTIKKKQEYLKNKNKYIGKLLTVKFQEKSKDGIPIFPVGLAIRDYE